MDVNFSANGDIIVTLLPVNTKWPWITAAQFRPELVPEELMAQGLTVSNICLNIIFMCVIALS